MFEFEILENMQLLRMTMSRGMSTWVGGWSKVKGHDHWSRRGYRTVGSECWKDHFHGYLNLQYLWGWVICKATAGDSKERQQLKCLDGRSFKAGVFQEGEECSGSDSIHLQTLYVGGVESKQVILEGDTEFSGKDQISVRVTRCRDLEKVENVHFLSLCLLQFPFKN